MQGFRMPRTEVTRKRMCGLKEDWMTKITGLKEDNKRYENSGGYMQGLRKPRTEVKRRKNEKRDESKRK